MKKFLIILIPIAIFANCNGRDGIALNPEFSQRLDDLEMKLAEALTNEQEITGDGNSQGFLTGNRMEISGVSAVLFLMLWSEWRSRRIATKKIKQEVR